MLEEEKDPGKLKKYKEEFFQHLDAQNLDQAMKFSVYCNLILQVFFRLEHWMSPNHIRNFRMVLVEFLDAIIERIEVNDNKNQEVNLERFIRIRCGTTCFKLWEIFEEICRGVDTTQFVDNPIFK